MHRLIKNIAQTANIEMQIIITITIALKVAS